LAALALRAPEQRLASGNAIAIGAQGM